MAHNDGQSKGVDISKVGASASRREKRAADGATAPDNFNQLSSGRTLAELARSASSAGMLKDALAALPSMNSLVAQMEAHKDAAQAFAEARDLAFGSLPEGYLDTITRPDLSVVSQFKQNMAEYSKMVSQHADVFSEMRRALRDFTLFDLSSEVSTRQISTAIEMFGVSHLSSAIEGANSTLRLGLPPTFHDDLRAATISLAEWASYIKQVGETPPASDFSFDIEGSLASLLARSIAAQEAILEEQREVSAGAKLEDSAHRRLATITLIVNILIFIMNLGMQVEERLSDGDAATRANTDALVEMRGSLDAMASQFDEMKDAQQAHAERQDASGAEIAGILRDIARALSQQPDMNPETGVGEQHPNDSWRPSNPD